MLWQPLGALYFKRSVISGGLPGARWAAWANTWTVPLVFPAGLSLFAFLLFPSGNLPSRRWRPIAGLAIVVTTLGVVVCLINPSPISVSSNLPRVANPTGVARLDSVAFDGVGAAWWLAALAMLAATIGSLVVRARSAPRGERQQVKLLAYAAAVTIGGLITLDLIGVAGVQTTSSWNDGAIVPGFDVAVHVARGIAILRHALYEIDRLISRTLSYAILTDLLVGVFIVVVALATQVLPFSSPVALAASTLTAAALFNPLRLRVQRLVDRRFNRARYDADAIVSAFTLHLREALDLDTVRDELLHAVDRAVEPAHASPWTRPSADHLHT
jgi:hypothetical protein